MQWFWVGVGGFVGTIARYLAGRWMTERYGAAFPYGTFLIGILLTLLTERFVADARWRLLVTVGVIGGYTTVSSYAYESTALAERGHWWQALAYVLASNALGLAACALGIALARRFA